MFVRRGATAILVALSLVIGLVGCSDPEAKNWVQVSSGRLSVDRPAAWTTRMKVTKPWTAGFQPSANSVEQLQVSGNFGEYDSAAEATGVLIGKAQVSLEGFTIVETRDIKIQGATTGKVVRYTITDTSNNQPVYGEWIVGAHFPYPQSVAVSILSSSYDRDLEQRVISTMTMKPQL
ncbi:MAG: hypothetical protein J2P23_02765 [Microlunatus sp.]|nr:hypothetical protein [Microlunatus sp.]